MSLIEKAAKRLEELRQAGVDVPGAAQPDVGSEPSVAATVVERAAARFAEAPERSSVSPQPATPGSPAAAATPIVHLDLRRLAQNGMITPDSQRSQVADEFRVVKRPLLSNATGKGAALVRNGNLIMVTSALPGEGKSFTAFNLAMSIAMELDHTVLLVDADVARPSLPRMLGLPLSRGLLDVLVEDSIDLRGALLKTDVEKLSILPAGTQHVRATELLASDAMNRLLEDMASRYSDRIIIFDSPPLLVTTESRVLATHMGQVVVVVEAQRTQQSAVRQALATIEACPVKMMMLNKGRAASRSDTYGYGYGYGYGH